MTAKTEALSKIFVREKFGCWHEKQVARMELLDFIRRYPKTTGADMHKAKIAAGKFFPPKCPTCGKEVEAQQPIQKST